jgi:hypothetical protein
MCNVLGYQPIVCFKMLSSLDLGHISLNTETESISGARMSKVKVFVRSGKVLAVINYILLVLI